MKYQREQDQETREVERNKQNQTYDALAGATQSLIAEYNNYLNTGKYDQENDSFNSYYEIMAQTCVMLLNQSLNFFSTMSIQGKDYMELLSNYFVTLPSDKNEAVEHIKHDCNVCYQRKNNQPNQV